MMTDFHDFAHQVGLHTMDMSSPALPMPQLNREYPTVTSYAPRHHRLLQAALMTHPHPSELRQPST